MLEGRRGNEIRHWHRELIVAGLAVLHAAPACRTMAGRRYQRLLVHLPYGRAPMISSSVTMPCPLLFPNPVL